MIPQQGQHVKCFMRSTMVLEGIIEEWSEAQIVLKSLDGESLMIVHRPSEDIMLTKIMLDEPQEQEILDEDIVHKEISEECPGNYVKKKLEEVLNTIEDPDLNKLNIKQLQSLVEQQDKKMILQKKKEHFGTPDAPKRSVSYSNPFGLVAYMPGKLPRK